MPIDEKSVLAALGQVMDPDLNRDIVSLGFIKNLKIDKVTVWDSAGNGREGGATANFLSSLIRSLPPIHDVAGMAGVELPAYLGSMVDTSAKEPGKGEPRKAEGSPEA